MPRLAANLTMLFNEVEFLERFRSAADAGFKAVEYLFPYDYDVQLLKRRLTEHGLVQALHNLPAGSWTAGERGIACLPDRVAEFQAGVARAIEYATGLGCERVTCLAGIPPAHLDRATARETFVRNLAHAAPRFKAAGIRLMIEAINPRDMPGYLLASTAQALEVLEAVQSDNLSLQADVYHMQVMEGDLAPTIERNAKRIAHVQIADSPGRHEPGTGEINYDFLLGFIDRIGYDGWIGCEYKPKNGTLAGLGWAAKYLT
jgi:hydroxypyruvate isomerase